MTGWKFFGGGERIRTVEWRFCRPIRNRDSAVTQYPPPHSCKLFKDFYGVEVAYSTAGSASVRAK